MMVEISEEDLQRLFQIQEDDHRAILELYSLLELLAQSMKVQSEQMLTLKRRQDQAKCIIENHKHGEHGELPWQYEDDNK